MNVVALHSEVGSGQLKHYADAICFSSVGMSDADISTRLGLPEYLITKWIANWRAMEVAAAGAA